MKGSPPKKLGKMAERWRNQHRGQFVVYTKAGKRFVVPLCYLDHPIFRVLLEMAEEEYGLTVHGPLQVPCEKEFMEYVLNLLKTHASPEVEKALQTVAACKGSLPSPAQAQNQGALLSCG